MTLLRSATLCELLCTTVLPMIIALICALRMARKDFKQLDNELNEE